ncbi:polysaccharide transporter, PST family [Salinibacillus kushneri]|uniref:Polysaccharide transporter, PST family n=1 Tax=Salinibacillus kushneri TaxID=237682 RepID=A0A1I0J979_9BACI|nr:polysaccharide biosynthesis protein [Salinibacillus kushneri]SEU06484.1 polysaccharide transporter, PST family [Salinibacillus kushneri]
MSHKQVFKGALLLTIAGILGKVLSAGYRVPLQNVTGDTGFYIYQQVYPFITVAWMMSIYGYPAAISKFLIETKERHQSSDQVTMHIPIFIFLFILNGIVFFILYAGAKPIAIWMGDSQLEVPIQFASVLYLFIPFTSFLRGSFQSVEDMRPTAISQTGEQVVRISLIIFFTYTLLQEGKNLYDIGSSAALSSSIAAFIAFVILAVSFLFFYERHQIHFSMKMISIRKMIKALFEISLVVGLNYMLLILLQLVDVFTMIPGLQDFGLALDEAKVEKGIYDRGQPLVQLGVVFGSSLSLALIPAISKIKAGGTKKIEEQSLKKALKLTLFFSTAATTGMIMIFPSVNILLFKTNAGTETLRIFMLMILLVSITLTLSTFLQGLGFVKRQALLFGMAVGIKGLLNIVLIPHLGIKGAALASVVSVLLLVAGFAFMLRRYITISYQAVVPWKSFGFALAVMVIIVMIAEQLFINGEIHHRLDVLGFIFVSCSLGAVTYFAALIWSGGFTREELLLLPYGERLIQWMVRRRRSWKKS